MRTSKALFAAAVGAALSAASAPAQAVDIKLSGQVSRAVMYVDDGLQSGTFNVDDSISPTLLRFEGSENMMLGIKAGVKFEAGYQSSPSDKVDFTDRNGPSPTFSRRQVDIYFQGGFGKGSLGFGPGAAFNSVALDLSGAIIAHDATGNQNLGGGIKFRTPAGGFGPAIGAVLSHQNFEGRYDRLRYDTPALAGFSLAVSHGVKDSLDVREVAASYDSESGTLGRLQGALGFSQQDGLPGGVDDETVGGSASWLHPSGLNLTLGHTKRDRGTRDAKYTYAKVGYKWGRHAVAADYGLGDDQSAAGDKGKSMSVAYVFQPIGWAELFALAKQVHLDQPGMSYKDIRFFVVGTRLKF